MIIFHFFLSNYQTIGLKLNIKEIKCKKKEKEKKIKLNI